MGAKFKRGDLVQQIMPKPVIGVVTELEFNGDDIQYAIEYTSADGILNIQPFTEDEIQAAPTTGV